MINFKEHWLIFKMLDKPVPLTPDAKMPCQVRMIQDDTMLGKANKSIYHPDKLAQRKICSKLTDDGLFLDGIYAYRYEIIGYIVDWSITTTAATQVMFCARYIESLEAENAKLEKLNSAALERLSYHACPSVPSRNNYGQPCNDSDDCVTCWREYLGGKDE